MLYQHLDSAYQEMVLKKWEPVLSAAGGIANDQARMATAVVLENTQRDAMRSNRVLNESYTGGIASAGMGASAGSATGGQHMGTTYDYGANDARIPSIVIPTIRRFFPELIAHEIFGVQPMNGPVGFAFAMRAKYGANGMGKAGGTDTKGVEIGYNQIDSRFTGTSGLTEQQLSANFGAFGYGLTVPGVGTTTTSDSYWQAFAGSSNSYADGMGAALADAEWWKIGQDMPMAEFAMEKGIVEAKTRKLAAAWSLELGEDMMTMHGLNVDSEFVNILSYETKAEVDRQLIGEAVKAAVVGGSNYCSTWSPVSADGRNQEERIGTLYTQILLKSQRIAILSRRGAGNFAVVSPTVAALCERLRDFSGFFGVQQGASTVNTNVDGRIAKIGTLRQGAINCYRDTYAGGDYILLGHKGPTPYDSGILYCPYIPFQVLRAQSQDDFSPRIGLRTRYGVLANLFGSANYYQFIKVEGLTSAALAGDGSRVFTY